MGNGRYPQLCSPDCSPDCSPEGQIDIKLKAATVETLQATDKRQEIPDDLCTGLYLVVQPTGKKSWQVRYRHGGVHQRMTLASFPTLTLAAARVRAREVMAAASEERDPAEEVKAANHSESGASGTASTSTS